MNPLIIVITGLPLSGKTSAGKRLAEILSFHHLDVDEVRHAIFPSNAVLELENRRRVWKHTTNLMVCGATFALSRGQSVIITAALIDDLIKKLCSKKLAGFPKHFFRLVLPAGSEHIVRGRVVQRYGTDKVVVQRKLERREHVRQITRPWRSDIPITEVDSSQSLDEICRAIKSHVPQLRSLV